MVEEIGKLLLTTGLFLVLVGALLLIIGKVGKVPGDILIKRDNLVLYFPLGTSLLLSVILSLFAFLLFLFMGKK